MNNQKKTVGFLTCENVKEGDSIILNSDIISAMKHYDFLQDKVIKTPDNKMHQSIEERKAQTSTIVIHLYKLIREQYTNDQ